VRHAWRKLVISVAGAALVGAVATLPASAGSTSAPGISATQVSLGSIVSGSGLAADFGPYESGVEAYLYYVNHTLNGVNGRQLVVTQQENDQGNPTTNLQDAETLVADNVFAVVGVSSAFFSAGTYLKNKGVPTFGYATTNVWAGPKNLFADYGSVIDYASSVPEFAYVAKQVKATKVAVIAYNWPSSQDECQPAVSDMEKDYGIKVVYSDLNVPVFGLNPSTYFPADVTKMSEDGVNMVISCMQASDDIALTKQLDENGMNGIPQVWLDGYDRPTLNNPDDGVYMNNVYLMLQHVPFESYTAYPKVFPGLGLYFKEMTASGNASEEYDDVALMGWESANLFTEGLRAAGKNPTRAAVISDINKITKDVGGPTGLGVTAPTNWTIAHTKNSSPSCVTFVTTTGTSNPPTASFKVAFSRKSDPWVCFPTGSKANLSKPVNPPAGTPGG
jgi:hypothetical protein